MEDLFEQPTTCKSCGNLFELNEGFPSEKNFIGSVICDQCSDEEAEEMERDDEIEDLKTEIDDAEIIILKSRQRLIELAYKVPTKVFKPNY